MASDNKDPGYTNESLRMLKSEEGQLNAVFACYGSAAQFAQFFEEALARFLSVYNRICVGTISVQDLKAFDAKQSKKTMGQLLRESQSASTTRSNNVTS